MGLIYDGLMYERIYEILKDRIESGVLPAGTKLPSRDSLCREFGTSGKTIRRVLSMLKENGLIDTPEKASCCKFPSANQASNDTSCVKESRYLNYR